MAAKTQQVPQDNTGSSVLSQTSPLIDLSTSVLASVLSLPEHPLIVYSVFTCLPATASDPLDQLELARRSILTRNQGKSLLESLLPCVHVSKDTSTLYVFAFEDALLGLGAGDWKRDIRRRAFDPAPVFQDSPRYVVVWLSFDGWCNIRKDKTSGCLLSGLSLYHSLRIIPCQFALCTCAVIAPVHP